MKRLFLLAVLLVAVIGFSQEVHDGPGPYWLWEGDTLKQGVTKISVPLHTGHYPYPGIWIKTTNPVDSTEYRIFFKGAFSLTDTFAAPSDTLGNEYGSTIMRISDTLWHYCSVFPACAPFTKIYVEADGTDHGNRARIWIKVFLWRDDYWAE